MRITTHDDIMARLKKEGDCVVYVGSKTKDGYGQFTTLGEQWRAHRYFYSYFVGEIPEGKLIRHTCHNPPCVLPSHLIPGTDADNNRDMMEAGRYNGGLRPEPTCRKGHDRTEENTYVNKKTGQRQCRACRKEKRKRA